MKSSIALLALLTALSSVAWADDAASVYKSRCANCHGNDAQGRPKAGSKLVGTTMTQDQIVTVLTKGGGKKMHLKPVKGLDEAQAKALADYIKKLK
jgi:mono/diheme cytochrome c family protein